MDVLAFLRENGQWIGGAGTLALAIITVIIVFQNRSLVRQNKALALRGYQVELVALVIDPIINRVKAVDSILAAGNYAYPEAEPKEVKQVFDFGTDVSIFQISEELYLIPYPILELTEQRHLSDFEPARLADFREDYPNLLRKMDEFDGQLPSLRKMLGQLALRINHVLRSVNANDLDCEDIPYLTKVLFGRLFHQDTDFPHLVSGSSWGHATRDKILRICEEHRVAFEQVLDDSTILSLHNAIRVKVGLLQKNVVELEEELLGTRRRYTTEYGITEDAIAQAKERYRDRMSLGYLI